jgi:uncharacterized damage-inducible protein DinB
MEIDNIGSFLDYFEKVRGRTLRVVGCIPPDKIEWTWRAGKFTLGDLARHIAATERYMFVENALGRASRYPGHGRELADGFENVVGYLDKCHRESVELLSTLSGEDLRQKCITPGGAPITTWKWLRSMIEHENHHRGQIYLYLAMLDIPTPPLYGLTSEEVRDRSKGEK